MAEKILIVTTNFWPEPTGTGPYATDLATTLISRGFSVQVLTGVPHYPWWNIPVTYSGSPELWQNFEGVRIERESHYVPKRLNLITRILFELSLIKSLRRTTLRINPENYDLVLTIGSSLAGGMVAKKISFNSGLPFGIVVHDLAGQGASQSGLPGGFLIAKLVTKIERTILESAKGIVAISQMMSDVIVGMGIKESKVTNILIYSANPVTPIDKKIARTKFGWNAGDFVVLHTGNMGAKQDLENVVRAAQSLDGYSRIKIYLVGHGNQENNLKILCEDIRNISVMAAVSDEDYSALLSAADLLLINERTTQMEMSLPSKLTSYLYSERPVLAAVPRGGATWKFLDGVAELVQAGDPTALASKIEELSRNQNRLDELAKLGLEFAVKNLDPIVGRSKYLDWVEKLIQSK
jgi:glycosyltransferase involved in cell wall biosynthesis